jgi:hypothetical protein
MDVDGARDTAVPAPHMLDLQQATPCPLAQSLVPISLAASVAVSSSAPLSRRRHRSLLDEVVFPKIRRKDPDGASIALSQQLVAMVIEEDATGRIERHAEERRTEREWHQ